ncbi:MAG: hypothetical protein RL685_7603 [Pseudomonadota bacterium]|jgi:hypothetical protein
MVAFLRVMGVPPLHTEPLYPAPLPSLCARSQRPERSRVRVASSPGNMRVGQSIAD